MPVSWQIAPSTSAAWSMFWLMMFSACPARESASSVSHRVPIAARTSGGKSVDVLTMRATTESKNDCIVSSVYSNFRRELALSSLPKGETLPPPPLQEPRLFADRHHHGRRRHWRQRADFQRRQRRDAQAAAVCRAEVAGRRVAGGAGRDAGAAATSRPSTYFMLRDSGQSFQDIGLWRAARSRSPAAASPNRSKR